MAYAVTHNNQILLAPVAWNPRFFNAVIEDDTDIKVNILSSDVNNLPLMLGNGIVVRECVEVRPPLNSKIETYAGPEWTFTDTLVTATYSVVNKPLEIVKAELIQVLAAERYKKEIAGTTALIQGHTVTVDTARGTRDIFVQQYLLLPDNDIVGWKFPECWLNLSKTELGACVAAGVAHVQTQFAWEKNLTEQINACTTHAELDAIVIVDPGVV